MIASSKSEWSEHSCSKYFALISVVHMGLTCTELDDRDGLCGLSALVMAVAVATSTSWSVSWLFGFSLELDEPVNMGIFGGSSVLAWSPFATILAQSRSCGFVYFSVPSCFFCNSKTPSQLHLPSPLTLFLFFSLQANSRLHHWQSQWHWYCHTKAIYQFWKHTLYTWLPNLPASRFISSQTGALQNNQHWKRQFQELGLEILPSA